MAEPLPNTMFNARRAKVADLLLDCETDSDALRIVAFALKYRAEKTEAWVNSNLYTAQHVLESLSDYAP
jgi:hypothetical protein